MTKTETAKTVETANMVILGSFLLKIKKAKNPTPTCPEGNKSCLKYKLSKPKSGVSGIFG